MKTANIHNTKPNKTRAVYEVIRSGNRSDLFRSSRGLHVATSQPARQVSVSCRGGMCPFIQPLASAEAASQACIRAKGGKRRDLVPSVYPACPIITVSLTSLVPTARWVAQPSPALRNSLQGLISNPCKQSCFMAYQTYSRIRHLLSVIQAATNTECLWTLYQPTVTV